MSRPEPVGNEEILGGAEEANQERGEALAEKYIEEQEGRSEDDPLVLQKRDGPAATAEEEKPKRGRKAAAEEPAEE